MAWLNAVPIEYDKKGRVKEHRPRIGSYSGQLPEPGRLGYLLEYFDAVGRWSVDGEGNAYSLSWQELGAWHKISGLALEYWELRLIIEMSWVHTATTKRASDPKCKTPAWVVDMIKQRRRK